MSTEEATWRKLRDRCIGGGPNSRLRVRGLKGGAEPFFLYRILQAGPRPSLVVLPTAKEAERFAADLRFFFGEADSLPPFERRIHYFPDWEVVPFEDLSPTADSVAARIEGLYHLQQTANPILVTTPESLAQRVPPRDELASRYNYLVEGDDLDRDGLAIQLDEWGYRRVGLVEDRGEFSVRGGIIDIYPPAHPNPIRLELNADTIEAISEFDVVTQRLGAKRAELLILPVRELDLRKLRTREVIRVIEERIEELELGRDERNLILDGLSTGVLFPGIELCLPYCYDRLDTVLDYAPRDLLVWIERPG